MSNCGGFAWSRNKCYLRKKGSNLRYVSNPKFVSAKMDGCSGGSSSGGSSSGGSSSGGSSSGGSSSGGSSSGGSSSGGSSSGGGTTGSTCLGIGKKYNGESVPNGSTNDLDSAKECQQYCYNNSKCRYWNWDDSRGKCFMKKKKGSISRK